MFVSMTQHTSANSTIAGPLRILLYALATSLVWMLVGCLGTRTPDLSGSWETDELGTLVLVQSGNVLYADQKNPDFKAFFGPKMFEGVISEGLLTGKVATALPMKSQEICGQNWGRWADLELRVAPDGMALEGRWVQETNDVNTPGCPITKTGWAPFRLTRSAGQPPVQVNTLPQWVPVLIVAFGLLIGIGFRYLLVWYLVGPMKRSPNTASAAGGALLSAFVTGFAAIAAPLWGPPFVSALVWGPLACLSLVGLLGALILCRKQ